MDGLIPTIIQDVSGQVLTLAYSSEESLKKALENKLGYYFSRSRNKICMKGISSGNTQELIDVKTDCDNDALLFKVKQKNFACHKGNFSCFGDEEFSLDYLWKIIKNRKEFPSNESFTSSLFQSRKGAVNKIAEKLGEETTEFILAAKDDDKKQIIYECADLLFFCLVMLVEKNICFSEIIEELKRRN